MVICSGNLLDAGDELNARALAEEQLDEPDERRPMFDLDHDELDEDVISGPMKCLQIDLQRFGLGSYSSFEDDVHP